MISIASWNINSVRLRIEQVARMLREQAVDVLCLQEIKCQEHQFPAQALADRKFAAWRAARSQPRREEVR